MNVEKIDKLIERLWSLPDVQTEQPLSLMEDWFAETPCGTVGCIAGEACLMEGCHLPFADRVNGPYRKAIEILGIGDRQADNVFYVGGWPDDLVDKWHAANSLTQQRAVMIKRLEYLKEFGR